MKSFRFLHVCGLVERSIFGSWRAQFCWALGAFALLASLAHGAESPDTRLSAQNLHHSGRPNCEIWLTEPLDHESKQIWTAHESDEFWSKIDQDFSHQLRKLRHDHEEIFRPRPYNLLAGNHFSNFADPYLNFLTQMGFDFTDPSHEISFQVVMRKVQERRHDLLTHHGYHAEDLVEPGWTFVNTHGQLFHVLYRHPIPPGSSPIEFLMTGSVYGQAVRRGVQPMAPVEADFNLDMYTTGLNHDLVHLDAMLFAHPEFTRAVRRALRAVDEDRRQGAKLNAGYATRIADVFESLELPIPGPKLNNNLYLPEPDPDGIYRFEKVLNHLHERSMSMTWSQHFDLHAAIAKLARDYNQIIAQYGGTARDPGIKYLADENIGTFQLLLRTAIAKLSAGREEEALAWFAILQTSLANLRGFSVEEYVTESLKLNLDHNSRLIRTICESKMYETGLTSDINKVYGCVP